MHALVRLSVCCVTWALLSSCGGDTDEETVPLVPSTTQSDCGDPSPDEESSGFAIVTHSPATDATRCALVTRIRIEFSQPLMEQTLSSETVSLLQNGTGVAAQLIYTPGSDELVIAPETPLQPQTEYTVTVTGELMATDGSLFPGESWSFVTAGNVGATPQAIIDECMSADDIEMLALVNNARAVARNCGDQPAGATGPLVWHCTIDHAAQGHSDDMAGNDFFSHTGSDGSTVGDRLTDAGYPWQSAGENIAAGQESVGEVMQGLLDSPGHCLNIMNAAFSEMGAALSENPASFYGRYWTQNFARPR